MNTTRLRNLMIDALCGSRRFTAAQVAQVFGLRSEQVHRICRDQLRQARTAEQRALQRARERVAAEIERISRPLTPDAARTLAAAGKVKASAGLHPLGPNALTIDVVCYGGGQQP